MARNSGNSKCPCPFRIGLAKSKAIQNADFSKYTFMLTTGDWLFALALYTVVIKGTEQSRLLITGLANFKTNEN
jgi:hypothetical protein